MARPRIRSLKPENWADEAVGDVSRDARLLRDVLITFADDDGRWRHRATEIIGFGYPEDDDVSPLKIKRWAAELVKNELVFLYESVGKPYGCFPKWHLHQQISKYKPSDLPPPPTGIWLSKAEAAAIRTGRGPDEDLPEDMPEDGTATGALPDEANPPAVIRSVPIPSEVVARDLPPAAGIRQVFDAWQASKKAHSGREQTGILDDAARRIIQRALRTHSLDDVVAAVQGWRNSPFHRGENPDGTVHNALRILLRDAGQIEKFRDLNSTSTTDLATFAADVDRAQAELKARATPRPPAAA